MKDHYVSYLLRLRKFEGEGQDTWRASLECTRTGEQVHFTMEGLLAFLGERFGPAEPGSREETTPAKPLHPPA